MNSRDLIPPRLAKVHPVATEENPEVDQLSDKEKEEYRAAGKCFRCGDEGHMSRNCPENTMEKSRAQGPPGTPAVTFNVEHLGAIHFGDPEQLAPVAPWRLSEWKEHYPLEPPFPGDELFYSFELHPELRFHVEQYDETRDYVIHDRLVNDQVDIARSVKIEHQHSMGDAISTVATKLITDGISLSYPCINPGLSPADRFYVHLARYRKHGWKSLISI